MSDTPKIRFVGFTDAWEQRKLGDIAVEVKRKADKNSIAPIMMISASDGFIKQSERYSTNNAGSSLKNYTLLYEGELAYNHGYSKLRNFGSVFDLKVKEARVPFVYHAFSLPKDCPNFFAYYLNSGLFDGELKKLVSSTARMDGLLNISFEDYMSIKILHPNKLEQQKIGAYFQTLDNLITLHQSKCDEIKEIKKYMLQKMFPENGKKIPEIRFAGFTDTWKQHKFKDVTEIKSASRVHKSDWRAEGVSFYRSSDVMSVLNGKENEKVFISKELYEKLSGISGKLEKDDVLITGGGSIGRPYIVPDDKPLYTKDADLLWIKNNKNMDSYFIYTFFFCPAFRTYLESISHVGTIAHYTITQLGDTPIMLPGIDEQIKIGNFFRDVDELITLHQRKCNELKEAKKFMLQNMFPQKG